MLFWEFFYYWEDYHPEIYYQVGGIPAFLEVPRKCLICLLWGVILLNYTCRMCHWTRLCRKDCESKTNFLPFLFLDNVNVIRCRKRIGLFSLLVQIRRSASSGVLVSGQKKPVLLHSPALFSSHPLLILKSFRIWKWAPWSHAVSQSGKRSWTHGDTRCSLPSRPWSRCWKWGLSYPMKLSLKEWNSVLIFLLQLVCTRNSKLFDKHIHQVPI